MGRDVPVTAFLALVLAGCASWVGPQALQAWPGVASGESVQALDEAAWKLVAVKEVSVGRTADGRLSARVVLINLSDKDLPVQMQTIFRDAAGAPVGDETPFGMHVLPGGGTKVMELVANDATAAAYTLQVKTP